MKNYRLYEAQDNAMNYIILTDGEGNANSPYRQQVEYNTWTGGESIIPITFEQARKWAEKHLDGDEYEAIFGDAEDDATDATLTISAGALKRLRQIQSQSGKTLKAIIDEMVGI